MTKLTGESAGTEKGTTRLKKLPGRLFHLSTKYILEKTSRLACEVFHQGPGSWQALLAIYQDDPKGFFEHLMYPVTLGLEGARDTRNRLNMYTDLIRRVLENGELTGDVGPCKYLDLACGCSMGPIRAAKEIVKKKGDARIFIKCCDIDPGAIEYSRKTAEKEGVSHLMRFDTYSVSRVHEIEPREGYDAVGTHGYIDYKTIQEAIRLLRKIRRVMKPGATVITTNMREKDGFDLTRFMMQFYGAWFIKYKTREELGNMLCDSGFDDVRIRETPLGHHYIATARKKR